MSYFKRAYLISTARFQLPKCINLNFIFSCYCFLFKKMMKISWNFHLLLECASKIENLCLHYPHPSPSKYSLIVLFELVVKGVFISSLYPTMVYHLLHFICMQKSVDLGISYFDDNNSQAYWKRAYETQSQRDWEQEVSYCAHPHELI